MKAIKVRYIGPTNTKPSRVVAHDADGNKASVSYNSFDNFQDAGDAAVNTLLDKMGWTGEMVSGGYGEDLFYVFLPKVGA